jgi:hypothetical protein
MDRSAAAHQIEHLQSLGFKHNLVIEGWMPKEGRWIINFQAGPIMIEPSPFEEYATEPDFTIFYTSWDRQHRKNMSDITKELFVQYIRSQPAGLQPVHQNL